MDIEDREYAGLIVDRIRTARVQRGWTQAELATKTGLPITTVSSIERCIRPLRVVEASRIAHALCVPLADLIAGPAATRSGTHLGSLGGGLNGAVLRGRLAGLTEKRHLVLARLMRERAEAAGTSFIDVGTDGYYPFYASYQSTLDGIAAMRDAAPSARRYPSSYGTAELRHDFATFLERRFGVRVDPDTEVMITAGAAQAFDALSRTYDGRWVLLPELALSTVNSIAVGNGAEVARVPLDPHLRPDVAHLDALIEHLGAASVRFLYLNSPTNPTGTVLDGGYLRQLIKVVRKHRVLVLHDNDSWMTRHSGSPAPNILQVPGAIDVAVTVLSVSKELGLPGVRVGLVAGNPDVVNMLRIHNSEFCVMIPEMCQAAASAALRSFRQDGARHELQREITSTLERALDGWRRLGWPETALLRPRAGFKFLFRPPRAFAAGEDEFTGVELFDLLTASAAAVKFSTSLSFNVARHDWLRMILMQPAEVVDVAFRRLERAGVHYDMPRPKGLAAELRGVLAGHDLWHL